jgi:hypothetical protein
MKIQNSPQQQIDEIKNLMERSSRFLSLSGLSGISAGIVALLGATIAFIYLDLNFQLFDSYYNLRNLTVHRIPFDILFLLTDGMIILILALGLAIFFTVRRANRKGHKIWTRTTRILLYNLALPLATGGLFCVVLIYYQCIFLVPPATLIFYGLSLLNASKYTLPEIQWLGISEILLGLIACFLTGYGLLFWTLGFGILHIIYGSVMYFRYESGNK